MNAHAVDNRKPALWIIMVPCVVNMLGDIVYEGRRSMSVLYLAALGAGAAMVGIS